MNYLLDTSALIEIEKKNSSVIKTLRTIEKGARTFITHLTICEYYQGFVKKSTRYKNQALRELKKYCIVGLSAHSCVVFCELKNSLQEAGVHLPEFDLMIASIALEHDMTIITSDKHFQYITGLKTLALDAA